MTDKLRCAGCGHDDRTLFRVTETLGEASYAYRVLCRYCAERLRHVICAGGDNQWPYTLVMEVDAPKAWLAKVKNQPAGEGEL